MRHWACAPAAREERQEGEQDTMGALDVNATE